MGRKGTRYTIEEKLHYINLVNVGMTPHGIETEFGIKHEQVSTWIERYESQGVDGLKLRKQQRYSRDFKFKVVQLYLAGNVSYPQLVKQFNISNVAVIYDWVSRYTSGKSLEVTRRANPMKDGRKTKLAERIEIAEWIIANDMNYSGATEKFNVSYGQVYAWVRKYRLGGPEALEDRRGKSKDDKPGLTDMEKKDLEIKQLKARLEYLSTENALIKKLQEIERMDAAKRKNIVPFKHLHK